MTPGLIQDLPLWLKAKARKEHDIYNEQMRREGEEETKFKTLSGAFVWKDTKDKHDFWSNINSGNIPINYSKRIDEYSII